MSQSSYDYVILGGGVAAHAAATGIRERDEAGTIAVLTEETDPPVNRPDLSKKMWLDDDADEAGSLLDTAGETGAEVLTGRRVTAVDVDAHEVSTDDGAVGYGKLLVATGGHPRTLDGLPAGERVVYFRTLADYRRLRALADQHPHVAVVGGGFIGTEIAAALSANDCRVTLLHGEGALGERLFPPAVTTRLEKVFADHDVTVRGGVQVESGEVGGSDGDGVRLHLAGGEVVEADAVVVGLGIEPATEFLADAVERSDDGAVVVDEHLATSAADVWAAGDVAQYPDAVLGRRRVEHVDHAETSGALAGRNLAGAGEVYDHLPMFYSDLFDQWYEAVGDLDATLTTVVERPDADDDGDGDAVVVYYVDTEHDGRVVGVLLWDCDGGLDAAKALLSRRAAPADPQDLVGSIF